MAALGNNQEFTKLVFISNGHKIDIIYANNVAIKLIEKAFKEKGFKLTP